MIEVAHPIWLGTERQIASPAMSWCSDNSPAVV